MSLKEKLPLLKIGPVNKKEPPAWIVKDLPTRGGETLRLNAPTNLKLTSNPSRSKASDINKLKVKKFAELLQAGVKPGEAAHQLHTSVRQLMSKKENQDFVKNIVENFTFDAKVRALLVRALVNKGMIENSGEGGDPKALVEFVKLASKDSEVGIEGAPVTNINVGLDPGFKAFLDDSIQDAEVIEDGPGGKEVPALPEAETSREV